MKILMTITLAVCSVAVCTRSAAAEADTKIEWAAVASVTSAQARIASLRTGDGDLYVAPWRRLEPSGTSRFPTSATTIASGTP